MTTTERAELVTLLAAEMPANARVLAQIRAERAAKAAAKRAAAKPVALSPAPK